MIAHSSTPEHVTIAVAGVGLIVGYTALWRRQPSPQPLKLGAWTAGVATLLLASLPQMERIAEETFTGHMVQHLLVIVVAAPLVVVAEPLRTATRSGAIPTTAAGRTLGRLWHRAAPIVGPVVFVVVLYSTHLTAVYDRALHDRVVHELEHAAYLAGAVLVWAAVVGPGRASAVARIAVAFGVTAAGAVLGIALLSASEPLIPTYERRLGFDDALTDQRTAATIMWIGGMLTTVPLLFIAVWRWASAEERSTRRAEALADRQRRDGDTVNVLSSRTATGSRER